MNQTYFDLVFFLEFGILKKWWRYAGESGFKG